MDHVSIVFWAVHVVTLLTFEGINQFHSNFTEVSSVNTDQV